MQQKQFAAQIKALEADGTVRAYIATYRTTPDAQGDIIEPGAFTKSLASKPRIIMLWQHDPMQPCGSWLDYQSDNYGILATGKFNLSTSWGRDAYGSVKAGDVDSFSIGYLTEQYGYDRDGVRHLQELTLKEASPVTFAADSAAKLVGVKASTYKEAVSLKQFARKAAMDAISKHQRENSPAALAVKQIATTAARKGVAIYRQKAAVEQVKAHRRASYIASRLPRP